MRTGVALLWALPGTVMGLAFAALALPFGGRFERGPRTLVLRHGRSAGTATRLRVVR